jgi:hypothetical protein
VLDKDGCCWLADFLDFTSRWDVGRGKKEGGKNGSGERCEWRASLSLSLEHLPYHAHNIEEWRTRCGPVLHFALGKVG